MIVPSNVKRERPQRPGFFDDRLTIGTGPCPPSPVSKTQSFTALYLALLSQLFISIFFFSVLEFELMAHSLSQPFFVMGFSR
jgi:hypothetical protein